MKVTCERCHSTCSVGEERVPLNGARVACPACGGVMVVPPPGGALPRRPASPFPPAPRGRQVDFGKTQAMLGGEEAALTIAKAYTSSGVLFPGVAYAILDKQTGQSHPVPSPEFVVGRTGADLAFSDPEISRRHCLVKVMGDYIIVIDLESTNGTLVRGEKVKAARLTNGQSFTLGKTTLVFCASPMG